MKLSSVRTILEAASANHHRGTIHTTSGQSVPFIFTDASAPTVIDHIAYNADTDVISLLSNRRYVYIDCNHITHIDITIE